MDKKERTKKPMKKGAKWGACHFYMGLFGVFSRCAVGIYRGNRFGKGREKRLGGLAERIHRAS